MNIRTALAALMMTVIAAPHLYADERPPMDHYKALTNKNLFRKLGWRPPDNRPRYSLLMTVVIENETEEDAVELTEEEQFLLTLYGDEQETPEDPTAELEAAPRKNYARIQRQGGSTYTVEEGDEFENMTLTFIAAGRVTIVNGEGEETNLSLPTASGATGGSANRGGSSRRSQTSSRSSSNNSGRERGNFEGMPREMRERMERLRNASPEERAEIIRSMRGGRGRRGGRD